jgi:stalled ribosome alternative rescue factor ArfA
MFETAKKGKGSFDVMITRYKRKAREQDAKLYGLGKWSFADIAAMIERSRFG